MALHQALLGGSRVAPAKLAERLLSSVVPVLRKQLLSSYDIEDLLPAALGESIANYLKYPDRYDPSLGGLVPYVAMDARGDILNALKRRSRWRSKEVASLENRDTLDVAFDPSDRNVNVEEEALDRVELFEVNAEQRERFEEELARFTHEERRVIELVTNNVRATSAYADALGLTHLPVDQQRREVKKWKDRVKRRMERIRDRLA